MHRVTTIAGAPEMPNTDPLIVRIVVEGTLAKKAGQSNCSKARKALLEAFGSNRWPGNAMFAVTPGGFVQAPFPEGYDGKCGWGSRTKDFRTLVKHARKVVDDVVTPKVMNAARGRAEFLTLGVDLNGDGGKGKMAAKSRGIHTELVAIVDMATGKPVQWTGKSYPLPWQEETLVQETNLKSHLFRCGDVRVLVLGCHDLNMFSNRAYAAQKPEGLRRERCDRMRNLATKFRPTMILHHPHSTDSPWIWSTPWSGARAVLSRKAAKQHAWASGIAFHNGDQEPRGDLCDVQFRTRCCDDHVSDVRVRAVS